MRPPRRSPPPPHPTLRRRKEETVLRPEPDARESHPDPCFRIDRYGNWFYHDNAITRKEMVCILAMTLECWPDGTYFVNNPIVSGTALIEDAPFIIQAVVVGSSEGVPLVSLCTNIDRIVALDRNSTLYSCLDPTSGLPALYIDLGRNLTARFGDSACRTLATTARRETIDGREDYGVWSDGIFFPLPDLSGYQEHGS